MAKCQSPEGGFGGGPGQHPHLASTYAAINALCTIGTPQAYQVIDRYIHKGNEHSDRKCTFDLKILFVRFCVLILGKDLNNF